MIATCAEILKCLQNINFPFSFSLSVRFIASPAPSSTHANKLPPRFLVKYAVMSLETTAEAFADVDCTDLLKENENNNKANACANDFRAREASPQWSLSTHRQSYRGGLCSGAIDWIRASTAPTAQIRANVCLLRIFVRLVALKLPTRVCRSTRSRNSRCPEILQARFSPPPV